MKKAALIGIVMFTSFLMPNILTYAISDESDHFEVVSESSEEAGEEATDESLSAESEAGEAEQTKAQDAGTLIAEASEDEELSVGEAESMKTEPSDAEDSSFETEDESEENAAASLEKEVENMPKEEAEDESEEETEDQPENETDLSYKEENTVSEPKKDEPQQSVCKSSEVTKSNKALNIYTFSFPEADISENTRAIYQYLTEELGLNHAASCGVLANIQLESGFNQLAVGDGGTSYGICQWHGERFKKLISFCRSGGYDYNTLEGQLAFLRNELNTFYGRVLNYLMEVPDTEEGAYNAGYYWCVYFEAPLDADGLAAQRGNMARFEYFPLDLSSECTSEVNLDEMAGSSQEKAEEGRLAVAEVRELLNIELAESDVSQTETSENETSVTEKLEKDNTDTSEADMRAFYSKIIFELREEMMNGSADWIGE